MLRNIRWRIAVPYVLLILIMMTGIFLYLSNFMRQVYLRDLEQELTAEAGLTAQVLAQTLASGESGETLDSLAKQWSTALGKRVTIVDPQGVVLGESQEDRRQMENHASRPEIVQARLSGRGIATRFSATSGYEMMYVASTIQRDNQLAGFVRLALPLQQVEENIAHLQRTWALVTLAATALAVLLAIWITSRTTQPLRDLSEAVIQMGEGRLESQLIPRTNDEIGQLTHAFNHMATQLNTQIQALQAERSRMAAMLSVMTDGVLMVDRDGVIQLANQAGAAMFGLEPRDLTEQSLIQAMRNHQIYDLWQQCLHSQEAISTVIEIPTQQLYLQCTATPLGKALPGSTLLLFQNLTRLRRLETVRQDFISNISHELRTPLASLKALTETLQDGAMEDPPAAHRFLERMVIEVDALSQMVEELLELSRIESGRVPLRLAPTQPIQLMESAVERLAVQAERAGLKISIDCSNQLPLVLADAPRLEQVLVNLLHNAIKFTPPGGRITLAAQNTQADRVCFSVQDNGVGIAPDDVARIFERFYKADRARASRGTGLGLAIARHLVEAHGGKIWVESQERKGSTFYFDIPTAG